MIDYADKSALRREFSVRHIMRLVRIKLLMYDIDNINRLIARVDNERAQFLADRATSQDKLRALLKAAI